MKWDSSVAHSCVDDLVLLGCSGNGPLQVRVPCQARHVVTLHLLKEGFSNATGHSLTKVRVFLLPMGWKGRLIKGRELFLVQPLPGDTQAKAELGRNTV